MDAPNSPHCCITRQPLPVEYRQAIIVLRTGVAIAPTLLKNSPPPCWKRLVNTATENNKKTGSYRQTAHF